MPGAQLTQFVSQHWRGIVLAAAPLAALGFFAGGWALGHRRESAASLSTSVDAGLQANSASTASATCGPCQCDAGIRVVIKPGKPVFIFAEADAGPSGLVCPDCPTVTVEASTSATGGAATASSSSDAGAAVSVATEASVSLPKGSQAPPGPVFEAMAGLGYSFDGNLVVPAGVVWHPGGGRLGVGVLVQAKPSALSQTSGSVVLELGL